AVDGGWRCDCIAAFRQQIDPLPFPTAQGQVVWQAIVEMWATPRLRGVGVSQLRMLLDERRIAVGMIEIQYEQAGNASGDDAEAGEADVKKPVLKVSLGDFPGLPHAPGN